MFVIRSDLQESHTYKTLEHKYLSKTKACYSFLRLLNYNSLPSQRQTHLQTTLSYSALIMSPHFAAPST